MADKPPRWGPPNPQDWKVGDAVYARYYRSSTDSYFIRGEGRIIAIEGDELVLQTRTKGIVREKRLGWPRWKTRAEAEHDIANDPLSKQPSGPMAHYTPPTPEPGWECLLCEQLRLELAPTVAEHAVRCPKRDPAVKS